MPARGNAAGVKRAILPAAISDPAVCRLLVKAESREQPPRRRSGRFQTGTERDDHQEQNSAYSPTLLTMVPIAQSAERLSVEQEVAGSCPARHPGKKLITTRFIAQRYGVDAPAHVRLVPKWCQSLNETAFRVRRSFRVDSARQRFRSSLVRELLPLEVRRWISLVCGLAAASWPRW